MRLGFNTNGFAHHRLDDALEILAELGYTAVAITPDVNHLPPFDTTSAELARVRRRLESLGLAVVIEAGARYVLDARRKQRPNLLEDEPEERKARLRFLARAAEMCAELGGSVVSFWAGVLPEGVSEAEGWGRLVEGTAAACERAAGVGVGVAFEPEPGMLVETLAAWERLRDAVAHPAFGLTLDVGHVPVTESFSPADAIRRYADSLLNVHLDDSRGGIHEHLQIGEGEIDWPPVVSALRDIHFSGIAAFELSRHSHAAPIAAEKAIRTWKSFEF